MQKYRHRLSSMKMKRISIGPEFCYFPKDVPVKAFLDAVPDGLWGITPNDADLIHGKVVSCIWNNKRSRPVLTKKVHMKLQQLKKDPSVMITRPVISLDTRGEKFSERGPNLLNCVNIFFQG